MKIIRILIISLFAIVVGNAISCCVADSGINISPFVITPILAAGGILMPKGVLAANFNIGDLSFNDLSDGNGNMGGLRTTVYFAHPDDISSFPSPLTTGSFGDGVKLNPTPGIVFNSGKGFKQFYMTIESGGLKDEAQGEYDGKSYKNTGTYFYPTTKAKALELAAYLNNSNGVWIFVEADGTKRVVGSPDLPAKCNASTDTGIAAADRRGVTIEVNANNVAPAYIYEGAITLESEASGSA